MRLVHLASQIPSVFILLEPGWAGGVLLAVGLLYFQGWYLGLYLLNAMTCSVRIGTDSDQWVVTTRWGDCYRGRPGPEGRHQTNLIMSMLFRNSQTQSRRRQYENEMAICQAPPCQAMSSPLLPPSCQVSLGVRWKHALVVAYRYSGE